MTQETSENLMFLAHNLMYQGNLSAAFIQFNEALKLAPNDPEIFCARGLLNLRLKSIDSAIYDFSQAIKLNPKKFEYHYSLGCAYYDIKDHEKAISCFTAAIRLNPNDSDTYTNRGNCYLKINENSKAKLDYENAISINPANKLAIGAQIVMVVDEWKKLVFKGNMFTKWTYDQSCSLEELDRTGYPFSMACFQIHDHVIIAIGMERNDQTPKSFIEENQVVEFKIDLQKERKVLDTLLGQKIVYYAKRYDS